LTNNPNQEAAMLVEADDRGTRIEELQALFRSTQALPQIKAITEEMIAEEVEAYRVSAQLSS